jgi:hypothetical protein
MIGLFQKFNLQASGLMSLNQLTAATLPSLVARSGT